MKSILIVGMGRFGKHLAAKLVEQGNEVMAIDKEEARINEVLPFVTTAQIGDSCSEPFIASLGVRNFDLCVVAIGDGFQSSLETTALLKDMGAKRVLARASRDVHAKFLLRNGADKVVYVEKEMAERIAFKYGSDNIFDFVKLTSEYGIYEIQAPPCWLGKTIVEKEVRSKYRISILATKSQDQIYPLPKPDHVFIGTETLIVIGHEQDVIKISRMK